MAKRPNTAHGDTRREKYAASPAEHTLAGRLEAVRLLLDQGRSREAQASLEALTKAARGDAGVLARARAALCEALRLEGRFNEALAAVAVCDSSERRPRLDP